ncbi:MAG: nitrate reductase [Pseudomonadota bacterium]
MKAAGPVKTTCPYCGVGCGVIATPQQDGSVAIEGDPEHPANYGRLCSKGSALGETLSLEDRLLYPEIAGDRVSWDHALGCVAEKFSVAIRDHGPNSVAFYVSGQILTEDYYVANKLMKGFVGSANIDTNSRLCMASSVAGHRKAFGTDTVPGCYEDLEQADLVVLVGSNLAWCHPVIYQRIAAAKEARRHMKVVLIDPRRTMTAKLANHHLAIKPDGDAALFCGLLDHLSETGKLDGDYINTHSTGFEAALEAARALTRQDVLDQTGLADTELETFFDLFANTEKVVTVYSQGVNQSACGTDKVSAIINCHLATGRIGKPGMGPFSITGQPNAMGGREVGGLANMLAAHMNIEDAGHRALVQDFWGSPTIAEKQGLKAVDLFDAVGDGRIKALWIMATNPVDSLPDADRVEEAIKACPFVVVSDVAQDTDTIRHADVKLPALAWGEKDGTVTNSERRISRQRAFLNGPGETRADWWHLAEVAKRMGFTEGFDYRDGAAIFREFAALSKYRNDDTRDFDIGALSAIDRQTYDGLEPFQWPRPEGRPAVETRFFANGKFYTPDRKSRFVTVEPSSREVVNDDYPFVLNTGRIRDQWHTMTRTAKTARLSAHLAEPFCEIHPSDALRLGLRDADLVRVSNGQGAIAVRALVTDSQKPGHLFVPMHWTDQYASEARVDILVEPKTDPFSGQPASKNVAVQVERFAPAQHGFIVSRERPVFGTQAYWALARCGSGWRAEFALSDLTDDVTALGQQLVDGTGGFEPEVYSDRKRGEMRAAWFDGEELVAALFLSPEPVAVSRSLLSDLLGMPHRDAKDRARVIAGRADRAIPDKGAIVCSCFNVGVNEISAIAAGGFCTVETIGEKLNAGTNCGSCRSEIRAILDRHYPIAAE